MTRPRLTCLKPRLAPSKPRGWAPDAQRGNRQQRGYGREWEKLREQILERDECLCQPCLASGRVSVGTQVDHVVPKAQGGSDHHSNLQAICAACHRAKTAAESTGGVGQSKKFAVG